MSLLAEVADLLDVVGERACATELAGETCSDRPESEDRCEWCRARDLYQRIIGHLAIVEPLTASPDPLDQVHDRWQAVLARLAETAAAVPDGDIYAAEARRHLDTVAATVRHAIARNRSARSTATQQELVL